MSARAGGRLATPRAALLAAALVALPWPAAAALRVVIIEGLGGEPAYTQAFEREGQALQRAARMLTAARDVRVLSGQSATRGAILGYFHTLDTTVSRDDRVILYLIGHGSFDGRQYKFNIPGPDLTAADLASILDALPAQEQLVVATGSSSGALLGPLAHPHRLLITATRNGDEKNVTHFGDAFVAALTSAAADTNKNQAISAREAFDYATRRVQDEFRHQTLLATEHAQLQGDEADAFTVASLVPVAGSAAAAAGTAAAGAQASTPLTRRRDALNARIQALEQRKGRMSAADYAAQLEPLLVELAEVQQRIDQAGGRTGTRPEGGAHAP